MTREGRIIGTLEYIAPERIRGEEADIRSDLYSAGIVLFEMLTGRLPFISETDFGLLQAHLNNPPPALAEFGVSCPPELEQVLRMALAKNPAERFQSAEALRNALAGVATPPVAAAAKPTRLAEPAPVPQPTRLASAAAPAGPAPARKLPLKWVAVAAAGALFLVAAAVVWFRLGSQPEAARTPPAPAPPPAVQSAPPQQPAQLPPELRPDSAGGVKITPGKSGSLSELLAENEAPKKPSIDREDKRKAALRALEGGQKGSDDAKRKAALRALDK